MPGEPVNFQILTREQKICLALWRKAFREKDQREETGGVSVTFSTRSTAISFRSAMYRAIRPFRNETYMDTELKLAAEAFAITAKPFDQVTGTWVVEITPKYLITELESQLELLGITEEDLLSPEEKEILGRLTDFVQPEAHKPTSTEFYDRG